MLEICKSDAKNARRKELGTILRMKGLGIIEEFGKLYIEKKEEGKVKAFRVSSLKKKSSLYKDGYCKMDPDWVWDAGLYEVEISEIEI